MQHECLPDGARSRYERRKPTKVLKIAESFTNLDETAKAGRYVRGPHSKLGRRFRDQENGGRTRRAVCCDDDDCDKESSVSEESERLGDRRVTGSSCTALRTAVAALYPFDDFILEKVGSGFFSEVFKVTHKTSGKVMVLKMNQQRANRPNMLREVQLMNKLKHPNILGFMGVCVHEGQLHALTEYMEGGSLEQLILSRPPLPLPQPLRVSLGADVAAGMKYLHSLGVFHRDLTTKNVLLRKHGDDSYTAVVADFGLAAKIPHPVNGYRLPSVGSPWWMSPECLRGRWYDHRSDIFSYGIILCQLIARVDADPDVLPRTDNFGLNYMAFVELCDEDTVPDFLRLAFNCCIYEPKARPLFPEIVSKLAEVKESLDDNAWGCHTPNNSYESEEAESSGPRSCPGAYGWRRGARYRSEGSPHHARLQHRRSLSELEWCAEAGGAGTAPAHRSASALAGVGRAPARLARLHRLAHIMLLRDTHAAPHPARTKLATFRGVKKILEPPRAAPPFASCLELPSPLARDDALSDDEPRCASLPSSPGQYSLCDVTHHLGARAPLVFCFERARHVFADRHLLPCDVSTTRALARRSSFVWNTLRRIQRVQSWPPSGSRACTGSRTSCCCGTRTRRRTQRAPSWLPSAASRRFWNRRELRRLLRRVSSFHHRWRAMMRCLMMNRDARRFPRHQVSAAEAA
ncbi:uncharacterized protein LOC114354388 isoform X4 [Ostrinia furnacalis]|uniref:uncharacterized protein LOC114354388 isoform X4 n=1 Tax=Ostrinia furnacalis TaxID=93504 RepID=UPI00103E0490|nr:uncharacterized protein LOC114354388 isoform X4 [Ostrinia furnacalis]